MSKVNVLFNISADSETGKGTLTVQVVEIDPTKKAADNITPFGKVLHSEEVPVNFGEVDIEDTLSQACTRMEKVLEKVAPHLGC